MRPQRKIWFIVGFAYFSIYFSNVPFPSHSSVELKEQCGGSSLWLRGLGEVDEVGCDIPQQSLQYVGSLFGRLQCRFSLIHNRNSFQTYENISVTPTTNSLQCSEERNSLVVASECFAFGLKQCTTRRKSYTHINFTQSFRMAPPNAGRVFCKCFLVQTVFYFCFTPSPKQHIALNIIYC